MKPFALQICELFKHFSILACLNLSLSGCSSFNVLPSAEYNEFTPLSKEERIMNVVKIKWEAKNDVSEVCLQAVQKSKDPKVRDGAYFTPPLACAVWYTSTNECTIYTAKNVSHTILGHEMRHCFEGQFHH